MAASRIDELRRRVQNDPASIAFAQLAEEYRRSGQTEEAVRVCQEGLVRHPGYLSARVTLGRALLDLGRLPAAREELQFVVAEAPENHAAVRGLAEIYHREGQMSEALTYYQRALTLARHDPEIEEIVQQLSRQVGAAAADTNGGLSFEEAHQELLSAAERVPMATPAPPVSQGNMGQDSDQGSTAPFDFERLVAALGTPSAPPQTEAAVDGRALGVAIDLPEPPVSLGPDPFAALEAELRATADALPTTAPAPTVEPEVTSEPDPQPASVAPWPMATPPPAETQLWSAEPAASPFANAATPLDEFAPQAAAWSATVEDTPAPAHELAGPYEPALPEPAAAPTAEPELLEPPAAVAALEEIRTADAPITGWVAEVGQPDSGQAPTDAPSTQAVEPRGEQPVPAAVASDDVLDELESWLTTLQDGNQR